MKKTFDIRSICNCPCCQREARRLTPALRVRVFVGELLVLFLVCLGLYGVLCIGLSF